MTPDDEARINANFAAMEEMAKAFDTMSTQIGKQMAVMHLAELIGVALALDFADDRGTLEMALSTLAKTMRETEIFIRLHDGDEQAAEPPLTRRR